MSHNTCVIWLGCGLSNGGAGGKWDEDDSLVVELLETLLGLLQVLIKLIVKKNFIQLDQIL